MNAPLLTTPRVEPFFFDAEPGTRFSLYHAPNPQVAPRGAVLYVHPYAEELSRTRRMAAQQSRAFAELGYALGSGRLSAEPFANLGYQRYERDRYTEKGGPAALQVEGQTQDNFSSTFGLRLAHLRQPQIVEAEVGR